MVRRDLREFWEGQGADSFFINLLISQTLFCTYFIVFDISKQNENKHEINSKSNMILAYTTRNKTSQISQGYLEVDRVDIAMNLIAIKLSCVWSPRLICKLFSLNVYTLILQGINVFIYILWVTFKGKM